MVELAIVEIEIDEVLDARIHSGLQILSSSANIEVFKSNTSGTASTTKSASLQSFLSILVDILARVSLASDCVIRSLETSLLSDFSIVERPLSTKSCFMSTINTSYPALAATCAIPLPICPAPITAIFSIPYHYYPTERTY